MPRRRVSLTERRKELIREYREQWIMDVLGISGDVEAIRNALKGEVFRKDLTAFLHEKDGMIGAAEVKQWMETHDWITNPEASPEGFFPTTNVSGAAAGAAAQHPAEGAPNGMEPSRNQVQTGVPPHVNPANINQCLENLSVMVAADAPFLLEELRYGRDGANDPNTTPPVNYGISSPPSASGVSHASLPQQNGGINQNQPLPTQASQFEYLERVMANTERFGFVPPEQIPNLSLADRCYHMKQIVNGMMAVAGHADGLMDVGRMTDQLQRLRHQINRAERRGSLPLNRR